MGTQFRLLGDVQVCVDGRVLELGHARQRCVLAVLLAELDHTVTGDQLVDRIWGDRASERARDTLYVYVSRLRRALAAGGSDTDIIRRSGGYTLAADPATVDLPRFRDLVARARAATEDSSALELFRHAVDLWHGDPLAGLNTPWLNDLRAHLVAERRAALLDYQELRLRQGEHAALLAELSDQADRQPLDERVSGQLMLALYRSGRQADAFAHYRSTRQRLIDELGTEPGLELRRLHQGLLRGDATTSAALTRVPRQLPAPPPFFVGRTGPLAALDRLLAARSGATMPIAAISGTAGIGKTALAVHWAHRVAHRFPHGQLYVNLRGFDPSGTPVRPGEAVRRFLEALDVPSNRVPATLDAQLALYRSLVADRTMLIVLDNARAVDQIRPLLPGNPGCFVLVTGRDQLPGLIATEGAHPIDLDLVGANEATTLLGLRVGVDRIRAEPDATAEVVRYCAGLPLAISVTAARAVLDPTLSLRHLATALTDERSRLATLDTGDQETSVRAAFSWSYRLLDPAIARVFRLLGLHTGPDISVPAMASMAGTTIDRAAAALTELTRAHLATEHSPGRFIMHDLLRAYATYLSTTMDSELDRNAALRRVYDHYLHTSYAADLLLSPLRGAVTLVEADPAVTPETMASASEAMSWYRAEDAVLAATVTDAARRGHHNHVWQLARTLTDFYDHNGRWADHASTHETALAAARASGDRAALALTHANLGVAYRALGRLDEALTHQREALAVSTEQGDTAGLAWAHHSIAVTLEALGRYAESITHDQEALRHYRAEGRRSGEAVTLNLMGWNHAQLSEHAKALEQCLAALEINRAVGDRMGEARTLDSIAYVYHLTGDHDLAVVNYEQAIGLFQELSYRPDEAGAMVRLGDALLAGGNRAAARETWQRAVQILADLDDPDLRAAKEKLAALSR